MHSNKKNTCQIGKNNYSSGTIHAEDWGRANLFKGLTKGASYPLCGHSPIS